MAMTEIFRMKDGDSLYVRYVGDKLPDDDEIKSLVPEEAKGFLPVTMPCTNDCPWLTGKPEQIEIGILYVKLAFGDPTVFLEEVNSPASSVRKNFKRWMLAITGEAHDRYLETLLPTDAFLIPATRPLIVSVTPEYLELDLLSLWLIWPAVKESLPEATWIERKPGRTEKSYLRVWRDQFYHDISFTNLPVIRIGPAFRTVLWIHAVEGGLHVHVSPENAGKIKAIVDMAVIGNASDLFGDVLHHQTSVMEATDTYLDILRIIPIPLKRTETGEFRSVYDKE